MPARERAATGGRRTRKKAPPPPCFRFGNKHVFRATEVGFIHVPPPCPSWSSESTCETAGFFSLQRLFVFPVSAAAVAEGRPPPLSGGARAVKPPPFFCRAVALLLTRACQAGVGWPSSSASSFVWGAPLFLCQQKCAATSLAHYGHRPPLFWRWATLAVLLAPALLLLSPANWRNTLFPPGSP